MAKQIVSHSSALGETHYNPAVPRQVLAIALSVTGKTSAKTLTPDDIAALIPDGADPQTWLKALRNVEYLQVSPKAKSRKTSNCNQPRKRTNYAEQVSRAVLVDSLFAEE
jgi:hypothetical protein